MRIIGGALRGRRLLARPGPSTRPTADRVREAIASALQARGLLEGARVLDLFAGTGALAFEALSRGALGAVLVDRERRAAASMRKDAAQLELLARVEVLELDLLAAPRRVESALRASPHQPFSLVFADPPYAQSGDALALLTRLAGAGLLASDAVVVFEHAERTALSEPAGFDELARYRYGDSAVALWQTVASPEQA